MSQAVNLPSTFDLVVQHRDTRGRVQKVNPYRCFVNDGEKLFERPKGSGNLFLENNEPAGRVIITLSDDGKTQTKKFDRKAAHIEYVSPLVGMEKLANEKAGLQAENEKLKLELEQIRKEREALALAKQAQTAEAKPKDSLASATELLKQGAAASAQVKG